MVEDLCETGTYQSYAERAAMKTIRLGCGAGFSGNRIEPAIELAEKGKLPSEP